MVQITLSEGEFALSKDVDVQLWLDSRAYQKLQPLKYAYNNEDFILMNNKLMKEFENFKKQSTTPAISLIEVNELIAFWIKYVK